MTTITFDTLSYAKKLKSAGFTDQQAEVQAEALADIINKELVTRDYLDIRLKEMESRLKADIVKWVAGMLVAQAGIIAALVKLL
jgi:hypothetical protein